MKVASSATWGGFNAVPRFESAAKTRTIEAQAKRSKLIGTTLVAL
jgi:hypothetical protein